MRAGYNFIWLQGVALAPNQFDFGATNTAGTGLAGGGGVFLQGDSYALLLDQYWPMALIGLVNLSLAGWLFRHRMY